MCRFCEGDFFDRPYILKHKILFSKVFDLSLLIVADIGIENNLNVCVSLIDTARTESKGKNFQVNIKNCPMCGRTLRKGGEIK